jgi:vanillate O-demethylase monooxygenase subunit
MYPLGLAQRYPYGQWWLGAHASEVNRTILPRTILGQAVVFFRTESGSAVALAGTCPHRHFPLAKGCLVGDSIRCGYHGLTFDASGRCVHIPSQDKVPPAFAVRHYPVVERGGSVWIWMGSSDAADPALLPPLEEIGLGAAGWAMEQHPLVTIKGRYELLIDNLLDLSHISFIHETTIPGGGAVAAIPPEVIDTATSLNVRRQAKGMPGNPLLKLLFPDYDGRFDQNFDAEYYGPHLIRTGGAIAAHAATPGESSRPLGITNFIHAITPETPTTTHYFVVTTRNFRIDDERIARMNFGMGAKIQPQDTDVLESIEATIDQVGDARRELVCGADAGAPRASAARRADPRRTRAS